MELGRYNNEHLHFAHRRKVKREIFFFVFFTFVIGIILLSSFYGESFLTGKVIGKISQEELIDFQALLSVPDLSLEGNYDEVMVTLGMGQDIYIDNKRISLTEFENKIIFFNFNGKINLNKSGVLNLEGKSSEIKINNIPINSRKNRSLKVSIPQNPPYKSFEIKEEVYIKEIDFESSGKLNLDKDTLNLNSERIKIKNYQGSLKLENSRMNLNGKVEMVEIHGNFSKISLSKL